MRFADTPLLWTVEDVLTARECQAFIDHIEAENPGLATDNPMYRDQDRVIRDDAAWAERLFERLEPQLPAVVGGLALHAVNERLRLYRYAVGQRFAPHMDHWYQPTSRTVSLLTLLVYLNDDFEGGGTRFHEQLDAVVEPVRGTAALFQHKVRHEGEPVRRGTKYALRSDVLYVAPDEVELGYA
mgnify:CR=1 FL=1